MPVKGTSLSLEMTDIGATLREARMRARVDLSEIEAKTKIRARYLRALENGEWDLLPGPTFVRSFLRTYAQALGLDGRALVEEYRLRHEPPSELEHQPVVSASRKIRARGGASGPRGGGPSRGYLLAVGAIGVVIVLLVWGLVSGGKSSSSHTKERTGAGVARKPTRHASGVSGVSTTARRTPAYSRAALSLRPSAPVYVCLIGDGGRKLIPGVTLEPPYTPVTYHATRFEITLGNNSVTMYVNGAPMTVPASSQAIGYSITSGGRHTLAPGRLPTCQ
jgi:cytoskeleton protein RodZ